ncbi:PREDICTED: thymidine kinase, cytosolic isoform X3 [Dipodomys ordii]|uniref:Thymidine kinase n=1 Tax=Dipodomys ordii TaxID=10020 RepID=A0A1S3GRT1_DIPOR|nr:PREDICTED: thymidine kinase, cytosolic isoform X3 [Dipodomys ordii]
MEAEDNSRCRLNTMEALPACQLRDVVQEAMSVAVVGIDEGQFFPDIVEFCETMANNGKTVIVAALDGTFQRKAFGAILNLVPLAESVVKLTAVCMECFREASYTKRLGLEKEVVPGACGLSGQGLRLGLAPLHSFFASLPPGGGDWRSGQVPLCVSPLLLQEVPIPPCRAEQQGELPRAGEAGRGHGCQEALRPSAGPAVQLCPLRA